MPAGKVLDAFIFQKTVSEEYPGGSDWKKLYNK